MGLQGLTQSRYLQEGGARVSIVGISKEMQRLAYMAKILGSYVNVLVISDGNLPALVDHTDLLIQHRSQR